MPQEQPAAVAKAIVDKLKIPPQPEILNIVHTELARPTPNLNLIADKVSQDGGLYSSILRMINSPYFGLRAEVTSIAHAISLLGLNNLANNIASIKLRSEMENSGFTFMPRYWDTSYNRARVASYVSKNLRITSPSDAYLLGMFKDAGIPILTATHENYKEILQYQNMHDQPLYTQYEDELINTNHCIVGYLLMKQWGLKESIRQACLYHHDLVYLKDETACDDDAVRSLILIMKLTRHILLEWRGEPDYEWPKIKDFSLFYLSLSEPDYEDLKQQMIDFLAMEGV